MRLELSRIIGVKDKKARNAIIDDILEEAEKDPIFLSGLLVEHEVSEPILRELRTDPRKRYKLYMIRGEWGEEPSPGFIVKRQFKNSLTDREGKLIPAKVLNNWKRAGIYDKKRYRYEDYKLDEKGCISVDAANAEYFLTQWGVHSDSGYPISYHPQEKTTEPVDCPYGGKRHAHYYRWKEMDAEMYDSLPVLKSEEPQANRQQKNK